MAASSWYRNKSSSKQGNNKVKNSRNAHNSGAKSQEWVNSGLRAFISSSVPSEQTRRVTWQSTEGRGGRERGGGGRGGCRDWNLTKERGRRRGGRVQADHVMVKSLQAAVLGKADRDIPPYWRCRFTTTTVLGNGCRLYCSYYLHGADSALLLLSSSATVAGLTLVLHSSHWFPPHFFFLHTHCQGLQGFISHEWKCRQGVKKKPQQIMKICRVT